MLQHFSTTLTPLKRLEKSVPDVRVVDPLYVGKGKTALGAVGTSGGIRRSRCWHERQAIAADVAKPVALEIELATTLLDDLRLHLRRRLSCGAVLRHGERR